MVASGFGSGLAPVAPGTAGSALAVVLFLPCLALSPAAFGALVVAIIGVGTWAAEVTQRATGLHDDGRIVVDEIAGQLLTLSPLLWLPETENLRLMALLVTGFVLFRVLDIWKPGWVRRAEGLPGGMGVMADDVLAGILGALVLGGAIAIAVQLGWLPGPYPSMGSTGAGLVL